MKQRLFNFHRFWHILVSLALISNSVLPTIQLYSFASTNQLAPQLGSAIVSVQAQSGTIQVNNTFTVTLSITNLATPLTGFQFDLTYDPSLISFVDVLPSSFLSSTGRRVTCPQPTYPNPDVIRFACASSGLETPPMGNSSLVQLTFVALYPGSSSLLLSNIQLAGTGTPPIAIPVSPQSGAVTISPTPGVLFSSNQTVVALPGTQVTHAFTLTNTGNYTDTFALIVNGFSWPTTLPQTSVGPVGIGEIVPVQVLVDIPPSFGGIIIGSDTFTITAQSSYDANVTDIAQGTTLAEVIPGVSLGSDRATNGFIGTVITYSLAVTNTGNYTDTFALSLTGAGWPTTLSQQSSGPLPAGANFPFILNVTIPQVAVGSQDIATIVATSGWDPSATDQILVTTTAIEAEVGHEVFLPLMTKAAGASAPEGNVSQINNIPLTTTQLLPDGGVAQGVTPISARVASGCYEADLDCDSDIEEADLAIEAEYWNCALGDPCFNPLYDLDNSNTIDVIDLAWVGNDYDIAAPVITITSPLSGAVVGGTEIVVTGVITDHHNVVEVTVNSVSATLMGNGFVATLPVSNGNLVLNVVAIDEVGQISVVSHVIGVDTEGPNINISIPKDRQAVYTLTPSVVISYTDFYTNVNTATLSAWLIDNNGSQTDITGDLTITTRGAAGFVSNPLLENTVYTLTVSLADTLGNIGLEHHTFFVPMNAETVTPPNELANAGWVSGVVFDSYTCDAFLTSCTGLAGASVTLTKIESTSLSQIRETRSHQLEAFGPLDPMVLQDAAAFSTVISGTIITGPDGFFTFPTAETGIYWLRVEKDNYTYAQREVQVVLEHSTATSHIYLTPLDSAATVCGNAGCTHTNSNGLMQIIVPPGAIAPGNTETLIATPFDQVEFLPSGELPPGTWETYAFNLGGDSEATFNLPVTIRIANEIGFDPGTPIPLGYWNQVTQQWEHAGTGTVDPTGQWVEMQVSHFSNYDCNDPIADPDIDVDTGGDGTGGNTPGDDPPGDENNEPCNGEEGCFVSYKSGTFEEWINLPTVTVLGEEIAPQLGYSTERALPSQVIDIRLNLNEINSAQLGDYIEWELYIEGEKTTSFTFAANLSTTGEVGRYRYYWNGQNAQGEQLTPGVYAYAVRLRIPYTGEYCYALNGVFGNPPDCVNGATGRFADAVKDVWVRGTITLVGDAESPFGTGWTLTNLQHLYEDEAGQILVDEGDSSPTEYYFPGKDLIASITMSQTGGLQQQYLVAILSSDSRAPLLKKNNLKDYLLADEPINIESSSTTPIPLDKESSYRRIVNPGSYLLFSEEITLYAINERTYSPQHSDSNFHQYPFTSTTFKHALIDDSSQESITGNLTTSVVTQPTQTSDNLSPPLSSPLHSPIFSTNISGTINVNTTWTVAGSPYIVDGNLTIAPGVTLTIEAGVVVKFATGFHMEVEGQLLAQGTMGNEIYFTSLHDDTVGGDTNGNGSATSPLKGDWEDIHLNSNTSRAVLDHTIIRYGGQTYGNIVIRFNTASLTVNNSTISNSDGNGIYLYSGGVVTVTNSLLENNDAQAIYSYYTSISIIGSTIHNNNSSGVTLGADATNLVIIESSTFSNNAGNGIVFAPVGSLFTPTISNSTIINNAADPIWVSYNNGAGLPILNNNTISGNGLNDAIGVGGSLGLNGTFPGDYPLTFVIHELTINSGATLTIAAGAILKFGQNDNMTVNGQLIATGVAGNPIYFTSLHDDTVGGDTNANGTSSVPAPGNWPDIRLNNTSSQVYLDYAIVRYGGNASRGNIYSSASNGTLTVNHSIISHSSSRGLHIDNASAVTVTFSTIESNTSEGIIVNYATVQIANSTIQNNGDNGARVIGNNVPLSLTNSLVQQNSGSGIVLVPAASTIAANIANTSIISNSIDAIFVNYSNGAGLPTLTNNIVSGNIGSNGIALGGTIGYNMTLPGNYPLIYVVHNLAAGANNTNIDLTIEPGVILKFGPAGYLYIFGHLIAQGTPGNEIYFTSIHDDTVGGDTNGNGSATLPGRGNWQGIRFYHDDSQAVLSFTLIRYGGGSGSGNLYSSSAGDRVITLDHVTISESASAGLYLFNGDTVTVTQSIVENSNYQGVYTNESTLTILDSTIQNNGYDGIQSGSSNSVLNLSNNTIQGNSQSGVDLRVSNTAIAATLSNNNIINNTGDAISVTYTDGVGLPTLLNNVVTGNVGSNGLALSGSIGANMTLPTNFPLTYVSRDLLVNTGAILTIEPGVVVKLGTSDNFTIRGELLAQGNNGNPIYFTSIHDDTVGGDTNGNGNATQPEQGDWQDFRLLTAGSRVTMVYVVVRYGGASNFGNVYLPAANTYLTIANSTISESSTRGIYVASASFITVTQSTIENNHTNGIYANGGTLTLLGNTIRNNISAGIDMNIAMIFANNNNFEGNSQPLRMHPNAIPPDLTGNSVTGNSSDVVLVESGTISAHRTWPKQPIPYQTIGSLTIATTSVFTVTPGVSIQFAINSGLFVEGTIHAVGSETSPILFTSSAAVPAPNDWNGVFLGNVSDASLLGHCVIRYGGRSFSRNSLSWTANLSIYQSNAQLIECDLHHSQQNAVQTHNAAPLLINVDIHENLARGVYVTGNDVPLISQSAIYSNTLFGIHNTTGLLLDARYNWWGDVGGPYHTTQNPGGLGNQVSNDVDFTPWLTEPTSDISVGRNRTDTDFTTLIYNATENSYIRHYLDGTEVHFDSQGRHVVTMFPDGREILFTYNIDDSLATMEIVPPGQTSPRWTWAFHYSDGALASITDPANRTTYFSVDIHGNLISATTPDGAVQTFSYESRHLMTHHRDQNGDVTTQTYDSYGRIFALTEAPRAVYNQDIGSVEIIQEVRTFSPSETTFSLINDSIVGNPASPAPAVPNSNELVDSVTYGRGGRGGLSNRWGAWIQETDGEGRTTYYERDKANHITRIDYPDGDCAVYTYNNEGLVLSETRMSVTQCSVPLNERDFSQIQVLSFTYESEFNQIKSITDPEGNLTVFVYDYEVGSGIAGNLVQVIYPAVEDEVGNVVTPTILYTYNSFGLLDTFIDERGIVTQYVYTQGMFNENSNGTNPLFAPGVTPVPGLLTQVIEDVGDATHLNLTTFYQNFDATGNPQTVIEPRGEIYLYEYDAMGRIIRAENGLGFITTYIYDSRGNLIQEIEGDSPGSRQRLSTYTYNANDQLLQVNTKGDGITYEINNTYDINRRLATARDNQGRTTVYKYDEADQLIAMTDPLSQTTVYSYTQNGELAELTHPDIRVVTFAYDERGNLTGLTPTDQPQHLFTYTSRDQTESYVPPDVGSGNTNTTYLYNALGQIVLETRPDGQQIATVYDTKQRVYSHTFSRGTITYSYNPATSQLSSVTAPGGITLTYGYDGEVASSVAWAGPVSGSVEMVYDDFYRITEETVNGANLVAFAYSDDHLLTQAGSMTLDRMPSLGLLTGSTLGVVNDAWTYNTFGEIAAYSASSNVIPVFNTNYMYDDLGRIVTLNETTNGVTYHYDYDYDLSGRLITVKQDGIVIQSYTYDDNGNRITFTDSGGTITGTYEGVTNTKGMV